MLLVVAEEKELSFAIAHCESSLYVSYRDKLVYVGLPSIGSVNNSFSWPAESVVYACMSEVFNNTDAELSRPHRVPLEFARSLFTPPAWNRLCWHLRELGIPTDTWRLAENV